VSSERIAVGLIGAGGVVHGHMPRLLSMPEVHVAAVCDPVPAQIARLKGAFPAIKRARTFSDYREMLDCVALDALQVHSPHTLHYPQVRDSLKRGLHVLVEKPMVCKTTHALDLIRLRDKVGKVLLVSYQRHFQPGFRYCREKIMSGDLGKVQFISALQSQNWKPATKTWRGEPKLSGGGQLNDSGSHLLDIILWMTDLQPAEVFAYVDKAGTKVDIFSALSVKFDGGALCNVSVVGDSPTWREDITIWCERGVLFTRGGKVWLQDPEEKAIPDAQMPAGSDPDHNFINAILGREEVQSPAECGLRVIQLTEAAWKSGRSGKPEAVVR
jgi:predicted dehydrogenase